MGEHGGERLTSRVIAMWVILSTFYMLFAGTRLVNVRHCIVTLVALSLYFVVHLVGPANLSSK